MNQSLPNTPRSLVFLDANILLEIILERPQQLAAKKFLEAQQGALHISALTAHLVVHFGQSRVDALVLQQFLGDYKVLALEAADFAWAFANQRNDDFEDALQLGVAIKHGCDTFVTFDKQLASAYKNLSTITVTLL